MDNLIDELKRIEREELAGMLARPEIWNTLDITYHPPRVERLWTDLGNGHRLSLHVIHPCDVNESLWHCHPWRAAFHVFDTGGVYEQGIGFGTFEPMFNKFIFKPYMKMLVPGEFYYDMNDEDAAHYVRPLNEPVYTMMLSGPVVWPQNLDPDRDKYKLQPLNDERKSELLQKFSAVLNRRNSLIDETKKLLLQYRDEEMSGWNTPYHYHAEGWAAMKYFTEWLERKNETTNS